MCPLHRLAKNLGAVAQGLPFLVGHPRLDHADSLLLCAAHGHRATPWLSMGRVCLLYCGQATQLG